MKNYLEIIEQLEEGEIKTPKIVKVEVKDLKEAKEKLKEMIKDFEGLKYRKWYHICYHEEDIDRNSPCETHEL